MPTVHPYLNFKGSAEEAFQFYRSVFGGDFQMLVRFKDLGGAEMGAKGADLEKIAHIALAINKTTMLMASDVVGEHASRHVLGNHSYIMLSADSAAEAERLWRGLATDGQIEMPLDRTPWAEKYGSFADRFGVRWMINYEGSVRFGGA